MSECVGPWSSIAAGFKSSLPSWAKPPLQQAIAESADKDEVLAALSANCALQQSLRATIHDIEVGGAVPTRGKKSKEHDNRPSPASCIITHIVCSASGLVATHEPTRAMHGD